MNSREVNVDALLILGIELCRSVADVHMKSQILQLLQPNGISPLITI